MRYGYRGKISPKVKRGSDSEAVLDRSCTSGVRLMYLTNHHLSPLRDCVRTGKSQSERYFMRFIIV